MKARERREAAEPLRRVIDAVERGDLAADGPAAMAVTRRLEGALLALRTLDEVP